MTFSRSWLSGGNTFASLIRRKNDMGFGFRLEVEGLEVADGYDPLMFARAVKTPTELRLLERATALNEAAIRATMAAWDKGVTWRDLNRSYARAVTELGGFVRDPGGMVWGHPRGADPALTLATGLEDDVVEPGTHGDVRLPRHHRSLLLGRRQDLGGGGRARRRGQQDRNYERSRGIWTNLFGGSKKNSEENSENSEK